MEELNNLEGECLCGKVKITVKETKAEVGTCHCGMCRKWSGGIPMILEVETKLEIEGEENVKYYDSSNWAKRAFCSNCGSNLFYLLKEKNLYFVQAGLFDLEGKVEFTHQVFVDKKPSYYEFKNQTKNLTEEEVFAMFQ